ncbi:MAG: MMPL family transporter, partial [Opitutaceae bacterium]
IEAELAGRYRPLSWQNLLSQRRPLDRELRRFVLARPVLDYHSVEPAQRAVDAIHAAAQAAGFVPARGVRVRVTGSPALSDDQLAALKEGAGLTAACSLALLIFWLLLAVRSAGAAGAILITLAAGLVGCVAFAVKAIGPFDPISIAFAPLFVGITVDFGIQFSVRYAAERHRTGRVPEAIRGAARGVGVPLVVAGAATAAGFFALDPTDYLGVSHLGLVAGAGMIIALILNLTLLPALLALFRPTGFPDASGFFWGGAADRFFGRRRGWVLTAGAVLAAACLVPARRVHFDFDPVDLVNPRSESVRTFLDLMKSPDTTPYTLDVLVPSARAAGKLARRVGALPEVSRAIWIGSFVPADQAPKLETLQDARELLGPTLSPPTVKSPPSPKDVLKAAGRCAADVGQLHDPAAANLAGALRRVLARGPSIVPALDANLTAGVAPRLEDLRLALQAAPVALDTIPADVKRDWIGADGRYRVQIFPAHDARDPRVLRRFVDAVRRVAPGAAGMPVDILESGRLVVRAFAGAGIIAFVAIVALLGLVLRNLRDIVSVLAPLVLAGLLTLGTGALIGLPLNFANIVTLPLLFAIGVAFDIYFVLRWRTGEAGMLRSPTARGVVFSALATGTAFGSLAFSMSPGMADMGKLLSLGLLYTLVCTLFYLPALLGPAPQAPAPAPSR